MLHSLPRVLSCLTIVVFPEHTGQLEQEFSYLTLALDRSL